jgi:type I restriction enzyme S subunit
MHKLPSNWQVKSLGEVAFITAGQGAPQGSENFSDKGYPFIRAGSLEKLLDGNNYDQLEKIEEEKANKYRLKLFSKGCILIAKSGMSAMKDRVVVLRSSAYVVSHLAVIYPNEYLDSKYLASWLSYFKPSRLIKDESYPSISLDAVSKIQIPLPPLPIQKQIAEILEQADRAKQKRKEANKLTDEFLQSVFIEMFGDPVKNPKGWKIYSFDKLVEKFQYGTSVKSSQQGIPVLRIPNVIQGVVDLCDLKTVELSTKEEDQIVLNYGDILFVRTNGNPHFVGRCALFDLEGKYVFASYLIRAVVKQGNANPLFLVYLLGNSNYRNVIRSKCSTTAGQFNINTKGLGSLPIILPPLRLQQHSQS